MYFVYSCHHGTPSRIPLIRDNQQYQPVAQHQQQQQQQHPTHHQQRIDRHQTQQIVTKYCYRDNGSVHNSGHHKHNELTVSEYDDDAEDTISQHSITSQVPITLILVILISYISIGTVIFSMWENWSMVDGAYFCFVTLSTIGFGDLVPNKTFHGPDVQLFACCAYLLLGLVLVAMSFSLLETQLLWKCKRIAVRLKLTRD